MTSNIQILGTKFHSLAPSVLFTAPDSKRLLFNCGEGMLRFAREHKIRLIGKLEHILFTRIRWQQMAGLVDLVMACSDSGIRTTNLYGPMDLRRFVNTTQMFLHRPDFHLRIHEHTPVDPQHHSNAELADSLMKNIIPSTSVFPGVESVLLLPDSGIQWPSSAFGDDSPSVLFLNYDNYRKSASYLDGEARKHIEEVDGNHGVIACYICHHSTTPSRIDLAKASQLGLSKGPQCKQLLMGESVVLPSGATLHPSDCVIPGAPGPVVIIIDCPHHSYLSSLLSQPSFSKYHQGEELGHVSKCIVHMTPHDVLSSADYMAWMNRFEDASTRHIVINDDVCPDRPILPRSQNYQIGLHLLHPEIFPVPEPHAIIPPKIQLPSGLFPSNTFVGDNLLKCNLLPLSKFGIDRDEIPTPIDINTVLQEVAGSNDGKKCMDVFSTTSSESNTHGENNPRFGDREAELVFLGTSASATTRYRNVSGLYLNVFDEGGILIDVGEATHAQLVRRFGKEQFDAIIANLRLVFITHKHVDHMLGLISILLVRKRLMNRRNHHPPTAAAEMFRCESCNQTFSSPTSKALHQVVHTATLQTLSTDSLFSQPVSLHEGPDAPLIVVGPFWLETLLRDYAQIEQIPYVFVDAEDLIRRDNHRLDGLFKSMRFSSAYTLRVEHSFPSYALILEHSHGWKFVVSGDTRPCEQLVNAATNATLLIHEGTFEESQLGKAVEDRHCTIREALQTAAKMNVYRVVLTHFSTRFEGTVPEMPDSTSGLTPEELDTCDRAMTAFDFMTINWKNLDILPRLYHPVHHLLASQQKSDGPSI